MKRMRSAAVVALVAVLGLGAPGCRNDLPASGHQLFTSPQLNPILLSEDGRYLLVANTTSNSVSVYDTQRLLGFFRLRPRWALRAEIPVGLDPVGLAQRPGSQQFWVANHISDTISVIDLNVMDVVATIQERDADGIPTTDAPVGIEFASPTRAFVTLDDRNEVLVVDAADDPGNAVVTQRLLVTAQAPRAMTVAGGKLFVAAFESENQTEFPTCGPDDPRWELPGGALDESLPDEGCEFATEVVGKLNLATFGLELGTIGQFAAINPNIGGRVIRDADRPDRDLFVYDANTLALEQVIEGVGTLLYGLASRGDRIWMTQTDARNDLEGLAALDNRMFDNRLAWLDCTPACGPTNIVDLDANAFGVPVPTPYGIRASADGETLVVSVSGSDGVPGLMGDPGVSIPGLVTLDAAGNVLGHVQTGAIPQGVALASNQQGAARTAYVLNTVDSTVSVVDVSNPAAPNVRGTFEVGDDPTPPVVRRGRALFASARASTGGNFSCESCHPNSNVDQLLWVINSVEGPNDVPDCNPFVEDCPEPRTTMPIRGLRDTLPLHWVGNLADPFLNFPALPDDPNGQLVQPEDTETPDCDLAIDGEVGCARDLVDASLSGVMCDQIPDCGIGPSALKGALDDDERNDLAAFLMAVAFPPSPNRLSDDSLTPTALQGVQDFFTDEDGLGIGTPDGIGQQVGFAPRTCADNSGGCHALPLTVSTNSLTVGGFDSPSMRGLWDRFLLFSNGNMSSEEWLRLAQECADGNPPGGHHGVVGVDEDGNEIPLDPDDIQAILRGDPCAIESLLGGGLGFNFDPFGVPSGETIYDPAVGMTERGQFVGTFEAIFHLAYGVRAAPMWEFLNQMSVGLTGLAGRQLSLTPDNFDDPDLIAAMDQMEQHASEGRITAVARNRLLGEYRFVEGLWHPARPGWPLSGAGLRARAASFEAIYTLTADLPGEISIAGADRQPLLDIDPDDRLAEIQANLDEGLIELIKIPEPSAAGGDTIRLGALYVDANASVIVDGVRCDACSFVPGVAPVSGEPIIDLTLAVPLSPADPVAYPGMNTHVVQVLNPNGWMSNEMPVLAR